MIPVVIDVFCGVAGPLAAVTVSWILMERTYRRDPRKLMSLMMAAFAVKMIFFGAYVAAMVTLVGVRPAPFVASFTTAFVALYAIEAMLIHRLVTAGTHAR